jgi:hypothetical protein
VKLAEFMLDHKLPRRARAAWPLVCGRLASNGEWTIVWLPGLSLAHPFRLTPDTRQGACLELIPA